MEVEDIIELDDNENYFLSKTIFYNNDQYFLAFKTDDEENIDYEDLNILKVIKDGEENYVELIDDPELIRVLSGIFAKNIETL